VRGRIQFTSGDRLLKNAQPFTYLRDILGS
jgi:hypothetical protein